MNRKVINYEQLAITNSRRDALAIIEAAYHAIDTDLALEDNLVLQGNELHIQGQVYHLDDYEHIYVLGFGKVASQAALSIEKILGDWITDGAVVGIKELTTAHIKTFAGTHPLPSTLNVQAGTTIQSIAEQAGENDLVLVIVGGGGSSLLCSDNDELTQGNKLYQEFLNTGGNIEEMNTIRKHISGFKGGGLAQYIYPAKIVNLVFSDVPGNDVDTIASGPTMPDASTIVDAQNILDKYHMSRYTLNETPKDDYLFEKIDSFMIVSSQTALTEMENKARELGYQVISAGDDLYLTAPLTVTRLQELSRPGTVVIAGGETRYTIPKECHGKGGRCDMLALEMLEHLHDDQVFVALASDGRDNSEAAGAIIDNITKEKLMTINMDIQEHLRCLDSFPVMERLESLLMTGLIESNISDLMFLITEKIPSLDQQ